MRWRHPALVDAFAVLGLVLAAVTAFADTFDGWGFLGVAAVGAAAGIGSAALVIARGWPWWTLPGPMVVAALLLGPPAALRSAPSGPVPGVGATRALGELLVHGWKDLLTTLPPVDGAGRLSALPFFLALAAGAVGYLLATRSWRPFLPVVVPAALAVAVIALGVADVVGIFVRALALFAGAVVWGRFGGVGCSPPAGEEGDGGSSPGWRCSRRVRFSWGSPHRRSPPRLPRGPCCVIG